MQKKIVVLGGGEAGQMFLYHFKKYRRGEGEIIGFFDDNIDEIKIEGERIPYLGKIVNFKDRLPLLNVDRIILSIPSMNSLKKQKIIDICAELELETFSLPDIHTILTQGISPLTEHPISYSDLLDRQEKRMDIKKISRFFSGKTILISGAGGSIGSEIVRQVNRCTPDKIILLGHGENSIYNIYKELSPISNCEVFPIIADIKDKERLLDVFEKYQPDIVYHAAAHKHVPLMEENVGEAIKNNILGTKNIAEVSEETGVKKFILVSTDKTVHPTSVMGMTKKIAEWIVQDKNSDFSTTIFSVVRFGNVLGSRGSAIPLFWKQINHGQEITITHPDMERYFMTIPEASQLVIEASCLAKGGEIFVLKMGEPQKIIDVVKKLIRLAGIQPENIKITYTGLRPGEKLQESLFEEQEQSQLVEKKNFYVGKSSIPKDIHQIDYWIMNSKYLDENELKDYLKYFITNGSGERQKYVKN
ncbi:polysaccharide biosynthesis protein [Enterococcus faecium]|nr:polysaccharide biosynthesis protein [Enterococcus faecium]